VVGRLSALLVCIDTVRRGGTVSISGVHGGQLDPLPMMQIFDKGLQLRMGQAHVRQWTDDILPLLEEDARDPVGVDDLTTHRYRSARPRLPTRYSRKGRRGDQGRPQVLSGHKTKERPKARARRARGGKKSGKSS
jgi:threonine dehydrogenase-like Zn-dependent dehydrogenase